MTSQKSIHLILLGVTLGIGGCSLILGKRYFVVQNGVMLRQHESNNSEQNANLSAPIRTSTPAPKVKSTEGVLFSSHYTGE